MKYFCTVKLSRHIFTLVVTCLISLVCSETRAYSHTMQADGNADSVKISLLTCSPGDEVYSLYGHTAIRYTDYAEGIDVAVNYGIFSFSKPFFVLRFIFGITDYEMGIMPFDYFCEEYASEGRSVYQQELDLTPEEKAAIAKAISVNYQPENRVYRYNYFYDNCTTRARNILLDNIGRKVSFPDAGKEYPSYRELTHAFNENSPWARFGNDILLGVGSDRKTTLSEHQFLPFSLKDDFDKAVIKNADGSATPLVKRTTCVVNVPQRVSGNGFPLRPAACAWIIFAITAAVTLFEFRLKKKFWMFDALMMTLYGAMGIIIFMMFFSQHPTTSTNLQVLLFNPLPLFFVYRASRRAINKRREPFWSYAAVAVALFFIGGFFQHYAEGTYVLASSLLVRSVWNIVCQNRYSSGKK